LGAVLQCVLDEAGKEQARLLGQNSPRARRQGADSSNINAFNNPKVKSY
jgi:hypothetical protein